MRGILRVPPALCAIWCAFVAVAALTFLVAFREPKRTALRRNAEPLAPRSHGEGEAIPASRASAAPASPETWSTLAAQPALRASFLPSDAPPFSPLQVAFGARLFVEPWRDGARACGDCHAPGWGYGDGRADGAPALLDHLGEANYRSGGGWERLEARIERAIASPTELNAGALAAAWSACSAHPSLAPLAARAFPGEAPDARHAVRALAAFLAVQRSGRSAWDRFEGGEREALSELQVNGAELFFGAAQCASCHPAPSFEGSGARSLRDLELRPPYGRERRWRTLREVLVAHAPADHRSGEPLSALEAFLRALGSERALPFVPAQAPAADVPR